MRVGSSSEIIGDREGLALSIVFNCCRRIRSVDTLLGISQSLLLCEEAYDLYSVNMMKSYYTVCVQIINIEPMKLLNANEI